MKEEKPTINVVIKKPNLGFLNEEAKQLISSLFGIEQKIIQLEKLNIVLPPGKYIVHPLRDGTIITEPIKSLQ